MMSELSDELNRLSGIVIDCAFYVHSQLGPGLLESVYQNALAIEFDLRSVPFIREPTIDILYRGQSVGTSRLDFIVANQIVIELKAVDRIADIHRAQTIHYLKATGLSLALLINFNSVLLKDGITRLVASQTVPSSASLRLCGKSGAKS